MLGVISILLRGLAIRMMLVLVRRVLVLAVLRRIVPPFTWGSRWVGRVLIVRIRHFGVEDASQTWEIVRTVVGGPYL